ELSGLFKKIHAEYAAAERDRESGLEAPGYNLAHLLEDPGCLQAGGFVGVIPIKYSEVPHYPRGRVAEIKLAANSVQQRGCGGADIFGAREDGGELGLIFRLVAKFTGF